MNHQQDLRADRRWQAKASARRVPTTSALLLACLCHAPNVRGAATVPVMTEVQPILRYTFDQQADPAPNDGTLGSGYTGDISGGFSFTAMPGGYAVSVTDTSYVNVQAEEDTFDIAGSDFSIRFVGRLPVASGSQMRSLVSKGKNTDTGYGLLLDSQTGQALFRIEGAQEFTVSSTVRVDGTAVHDILAVKQGSMMKLYVDGLLDNSITMAGTLGNTANSRRLRIGRPDGGGGSSLGFTGEADLAAIYDRAVTPADVDPGGSDCNANGLDDAVEISSGAAPDCNANGTIDTCEGGTITGDCNQNGICDTQELALGLVPDRNENGVPDDCELWPALPYGIDRIIAFGDSLSDTGNVFAETGHPGAPYWNGHFSNGLMWIEYLRGYLGLPASALRNYAIAGATSGSTNVGSSVPYGLTQELARFYTEFDAGFVPTPNTLFTLWIGGNDFYETQGIVPTVPIAMDRIEAAIRGLVQHGAQKILVPNLPDLGATPVAHSYNDPEKVVAARAATIGFNANLAERLGQLERELGVDLILFDAFEMFEQIVADPAAFGFTDVLGQCYDQTTGSVCSNPSSHVFWDWVHPTSAAHRRIALAADEALINGGKPLPSPLSAARGVVNITGPVHGLFVTTDSVTVTGQCIVRGLHVVPGTPGHPGGSPAEAFDVNGVAADLDAAGNFSVIVPLDLGRVEQPLVATLRRADHVIDRERIVVFRGPSIGATTTVSDAVVARLSTLGIGMIEDHLMGTLLDNGTIDIRAHLLQSNPVSADWGGLCHVLNATDAGIRCSSIEVVPEAGRLFVRLALDDLFVGYHVDGWVEDDPFGVLDFDCNGVISASRISVWTEFAFSPGPGAGTVNVTQLQPLQFDFLGFNHSGSCAGIVDFANQIPGIDINVYGKVVAAIQSALHDLDAHSSLTIALEDILNGVSISGPLSGVIGASVTGDINAIRLMPEGCQVELDARISPAEPTSQRTYAVPSVPTAELPQFGLDPETGDPYEFAISLALKTVNQLLLARPDILPQNLVMTSIDLGASSLPITAYSLAALAPQFAALPATQPLEIRVQSTLPPMLMGNASSPDALSDIYLGQVLLSIYLAGSPTNADPLLALVVDLRGDVSLGFHAPSASLTVSLDVGLDDAATTIVANPLQVDESSFLLMARSLVTLLMPDVASAQIRVQLPELEGLDLAITGISSGSGYATAVLDLDSVYGRPDLIVERIDPIGSVDVNLPFTVTGRVKNIGSRDALGGVWVLASLSPDPYFLNGNDWALHQVFVSLGDGLQPNESRAFSIPIAALTGVLFSEQTLFVLVDAPPGIGGTGMICERTETNNHLGQQILTTTADAFVVSVTAPSGLVGGDGWQPYVVRVGRNDIGPDTLYVPVHLTVGGNWGDLTVALQRGETMDAVIMAPTPFSFGEGGQVNYFSVDVCTNLTFDSNWANNCAHTSVGIAAPWWDLRFSIVSDPASARRCHTTSWSVRVTNVGNAPSMNVCALTGITLYPGAGNWGSNLGIFNFTTPSLAPGASWTFPVNNYFISCGAYLGTQYIKTEVHYSAGCFDNYGAGNFDQEAITITN